MKRLGVFFFYDKDGIADRYVDYLLESIDPCLARLVVVSNGKLTTDAKEIFGKHTQKYGRQEKCLIERKNDGFDVWAYRAALLAEGWEQLKEYDEIVLFNHTIMGPLYPFGVMFEEMEKVSADFWGISEHFGYYMDPTKENPYGYLPVHLQSHFIVCRHSLVKDKLFWDYWNNMPEIKSYTDSVGKHESYFTKYFVDHGFQKKAYVDLSELREKTTYPMVDLPLTTVKQYQSPIFKRKSFFCEVRNFAAKGCGALEAQQFFSYLRDNTDYDTSMIVENMIRTCHQSDYSVYLDTVLSIDSLPQQKIFDPKLKITFIATEQEKSYAKILSEQFNECSLIVLNGVNDSFTVEKLLDIAEASDYVCALNLPTKTHDGYKDYEFGFFEYQNELHRELIEKNSQNFSRLLNVISNDPLTGLLVSARLITLDHILIAIWNRLFSENVLHNDFYFNQEKIPQGAGLPFFIAKGSALISCKDKINSELLHLDLLKTGCADLIVSLLTQQGGYLTKSILTKSVGMANTNLQTGFYSDWRQLEHAAKKEIDNYKTIIANFSVMTALRIKLKRLLPKKLYAWIVKAKRFVFGPHGIAYSYEENPWESIIV